MSDSDKPIRRGEAAWKAHKDGVAERNAAASKTGRENREAYERERAASRRDGDRKLADLVKDRQAK